MCLYIWSKLGLNPCMDDVLCGDITYRIVWSFIYAKIVSFVQEVRNFTFNVEMNCLIKNKSRFIWIFVYTFHRNMFLILLINHLVNVFFILQGPTVCREDCDYNCTYIYLYNVLFEHASELKGYNK